MLTPEIKIIAIQQAKRRTDCPISGWLTSKIKIDNKTKKLKKYETFSDLKFSLVKIFAVINIKNGFINSIGWNLNK